MGFSRLQLVQRSKLKDNPMRHTIYLAHSEKLNLYYIGIKSFSNIDTFNSYKTSSSNKEFRDSISSKIILQEFPTRELALEAEVKMHELLNVDKNPLYANVAKQTTTSFYYYSKGTCNGHYSSKIHCFYHPELEESFIGTQFHFYNKHDLHRPSVSKLVNGKIKNHKGWVLINE